ncbi:MAG: hypothetical protein ACRD4B_07790, partial [Acidobacteriota bacterium]
ESEYLPAIQHAIATEVVKRTVDKILGGTDTTVRGELPEDMLTNTRYYKILTSAAGKQAYHIAQKISNGLVLDADDLSYLNTPDDTMPLVLTLIATERTFPGGKKDSLLRRFHYLQEKAGTGGASSMITQSLGIDTSVTAHSPQLLAAEQQAVTHIRDQAASDRDLAVILAELEEGRIPETVQALSESTLSLQEKEVLGGYFHALGLDEVYFVPAEQMASSEGVFSDGRMFLNVQLLERASRERAEVIIHETAHFFEMKAAGQGSGTFDTEQQKKSTFTHQQEGTFAHYYKLAALMMQRQGEKSRAA